MPRIRQVPRSEVKDPVLLELYDTHFPGKDPVAEPGTVGGTPGSWWTVHALSPDLVRVMRQRHEWHWSPSRELPPLLRELACTRVGWAAESQYIYSQFCKMLRKAGASEEQVKSIPYWSSASCYTPIQRAVLGYTDDLVLGRGHTSDGRIAHLKAELSDVAILELTNMATTYLRSSIMCRALRLEFDDHEDSVAEVGGPALG